MFKSGDIVKHFKRELITKEELESNENLYLYEIIGIAKHTESEEELVIYKPLYETDFLGSSDYAARPIDMFLSDVDKVKYPNIKQKKRFEIYKKGE